MEKKRGKIDHISLNAFAQDERVRGVTSRTAHTTKVVGFVVRKKAESKPRLDRTEKTALSCSHCHKSGHGIAKCFDIHGTSDWYLEKYGPFLKGKASTPSTGRERPGMCGNATAPIVNSWASLAQPSTAPVAQLLPRFTADQWAALSAAFGQSSSSPNRLHGPMFERGDSHR